MNIQAQQMQADNLHRNVILRDMANPGCLSLGKLLDPEGLWDWMDDLRSQGIQVWLCHITQMVLVLKCLN